MKLMAISLFVLFFIPLSSALEIQLNSPEEVSSGEEFTVSIDANSSENYDVKIFVHEPKKEFSEIYDGSAWRSPQRYLPSVFPAQKIFQIKAHFEGETRICLRLRKTGQSSFQEKCNNITMNPISQQAEASEETANNQDDEDSTSSQENQISQESQNNNNQTGELSRNQQAKEIQNTNQTQENKNKGEKTENISYRSSLNQQEEKLILNSKTEKQKSTSQPISQQDNSQADDEEIFTTKYEKRRMAVIYGFLSICVLIIILLSIRKL